MEASRAKREASSSPMDPRRQARGWLAKNCHFDHPRSPDAKMAFGKSPRLLCSSTLTGLRPEVDNLSDMK
ncbi:uncharacterized protein N7496_002087 [Penicillium cataractarum]|uniref:Uncharacterized protein n=1 Tax=Penicillium cataractarum TaxID=2100454 RepID=A0A9W9VG98_9EURO|nr:uncharacterized protein N7496_002087 [Penicillium cataractarum]KAJ5379659.1 hypothetical protein N7496_002087 [Penicillium cataractarum]